MGHPVFQTPGLAPGVLLNGFDQLDIGEELDTLKRQEKSGRTLERRIGHPEAPGEIWQNIGGEAPLLGKS